MHTHNPPPNQQQNTPVKGFCRLPCLLLGNHTTNCKICKILWWSLLVTNPFFTDWSTQLPEHSKGACPKELQHSCGKQNMILQRDHSSHPQKTRIKDKATTSNCSLQGSQRGRNYRQCWCQLSN